MRTIVLFLSLVLAPSIAVAQRRGCDPIGYPSGACGRLPDGCGGFVELRPCNDVEAPSLTIRDIGVWTLGGAAIPAPSFATSLAGGGADASWLYAYSNRPLDALRVRVQYAGGRAGWAFPAPSIQQGAIVFRGVGAPPAEAGAWTRIAVGAATPIGGSTTENGILMHAGTVRVRSPIELRGGGLVSAQGEHTLWILTRRGFEERRVFGQQQVLVRVGERSVLRQRLFDELSNRGLRDVEANALLDARESTLLSGERAHALYFLPRVSIDRAQPLRVEPAPDVLLRVRLIEDYR